MALSPAAKLASLSPEQRQAFFDSLSAEEAAGLEYDWRGFWARPNQVAPSGDWSTWLLLAGRGFGKTRCGGEWVREQKESVGRIALVGPTAADVRDVMVLGESGIMATSPPWDRPEYEPSKRLLTWSNGAIATLYSAEEPERLRGPQHGAAWADELCLVGSTRVSTLAGSRPIASLRPGDWVLTRAGFRRVARAWRTAAAAEVWELRASNGARLRGTAGHPVFSGGAFRPLAALRPGDPLLAAPPAVAPVPTASRACRATFLRPTSGERKEYYSNIRPAPVPAVVAVAHGGAPATTPFVRPPLGATLPAWEIRLSGAARNGGACAAATTKTAGAGCFIAPSGRRPTDRSGRAWTSTTRTRTPGTTTSPIWWRLPGRSIYGSMDPGATLLGSRTAGAPPRSRHGGTAIRLSIGALNAARPSGQPGCAHGSVALPAGPPSTAPSVPGVPQPLGRRPRLRLRHRAAPCGLPHSAPPAANYSGPQTPGPRLAPGPAATPTALHVVSVRRLPRRQAVYNIEVEGEHEYFANGLLTHNCAWRYKDTWDMLMFGLRLGADPRTVVTTTPKPSALVREILADPGTVVTRGTTYENAANLAPTFLRKIVAKYQGTRLGRQELLAEMLDDLPGALLKRAQIDALRLVALPSGLPPYETADYHRRLAEALGLVRICVAVDPSGNDGTEDNGADEIGIVAAGVDGRNHAYVLEDASGAYSPIGWGDKAVEVYKRWGADRIVAERNFGGAMVEANIRASDRMAAVSLVTASRGKVIRAEPVIALYEQGRVHHVGGFSALEDQLVGFTRQGYQGAGSPDRADAAVWALTDLLLGEDEPYDLLGMIKG